MQAVPFLYEYVHPTSLYQEGFVFLLEHFLKISFQGISPLEEQVFAPPPLFFF